MAETGDLEPDDRVELIDGEVLQMSPIGKRHGLAVDRLAAVLFSQARNEIAIRVQNPLSLSRTSEPIPDVALVRAGSGSSTSNRTSWRSPPSPGRGDMAYSSKLVGVTL